MRGLGEEGGAGSFVSSVRIGFPLRPLAGVKEGSKSERNMCIDLREYKEKESTRQSQTHVGGGGRRSNTDSSSICVGL